MITHFSSMFFFMLILEKRHGYVPVSRSECEKVLSLVFLLFNITFFLSIFPHPTSCIVCSGMMMQLCCFENKWEVWKNSEIDLKLKNNICTFFGSDLGEDTACHLLALVLRIRGSFYQSVNNHDLNRPCTKDFLTISQ